MNELSTIGCKHFGPCSGCTLDNKVDSPPIWSEINDYFKNKNISPPKLHISSVCGWRTKAKLAVRGTAAMPIIGLFRSHSHDALPIPECKVHHPSINRAVALVLEAIREESLSPYNETTHQGSLRYIQCLVDLSTQKVQLTLVWNHPQSTPALQAFASRLGTHDLIHSIWFNFQPARTNRIFGDSWLYIMGAPFLYQNLDSIPIAFHPASFSQAHWTLFGTLAQNVVEWIPSKSRLLEIYAGVGAMGLLAAPHCASVTLIENNPYALLSYKETLKPPNVQYHSLDARGAISYLADVDVVLVDPPRKGLDPALLSALGNWEGILIYVSCDFHSLKRDLEELKKHSWVLKKAEGYLLFPGTNHVETVVFLHKPKLD